MSNELGASPTACHLRMTGSTIHITPAMAAELVRRKVIRAVPQKLGDFEAVVKVEDVEMKIWRVLRP